MTNTEIHKVLKCSIILTGLFLVAMTGCRKKLPDEVPSLVTINVTDLTPTSFTSGGLVFSSGGDSVMARGICLSTISNPTIADLKTTEGTGTGSFSSTISGLAAGTTYYVRAYATNRVGTGYGNQYIVATSADLPSLTTNAVSDITSTTAVSGGNIISDGGTGITGRGVCWATAPAPTIDSSKTSDGTGTGAFTSSLTGLTAGVTYYVRAYATNSTGTIYGNEVTFSTVCNLPAVPGAITGITNVGINESCVTYSISAVTDAVGYTWTIPGGAIITSGQGTTVIMVDYGKNGGKVSVRAENSCGNSPFTELDVSMDPSTNCGTVTDADGNLYNTVKVGTQCWLTENLKTTSFNDGSPIQKVSDYEAWSNLVTPAYCWYMNDSISNWSAYGAFYNWYTVATGKLCPAGWHVPSDDDWTKLTDYLCGLSQASAKLKEAGNLHWNEPNGASTNLTGFTALPGGYRSWTDGKFFSIRDNGSWWSSTTDGGTNAWIRAMTNYQTLDVRIVSANKNYGISVRCLKD